MHVRDVDGMKKVLSPQQKKANSYAKDRRNSYGERGANSRFAIRENKLYVSRSRRRLENSQIQSVRLIADEDTLSQIDHAVKASGASQKQFRKHADSSLGLVVGYKLMRRQNARDVANEPSPQDSTNLMSTEVSNTQVTERFSGWVLPPDEVTWAGTAGGSGGRTNYSVTLKLTHKPTGLWLEAESPKGNYTRIRAAAMRERLYQQLFQELEQLIALHLHIPRLLKRSDH